MKKLLYLIPILLLFVVCKTYYPSSTQSTNACYSCHGTGRIDCAMCQGTGLGSMCYNCQGAGRTYAEYIGSWQKCYSCGGKGYNKCYGCNGKGWIKCRKCNGKGIR